jgi:diguanylate cyclase (GGDEF)-like protein/putative nucleotidyltransferase with HDIG domain
MAKILIADDEEALRLIITRQLRRSGHDVTAAEDGMVALEHLKSSTFDVVVSDMKMPRLNGMDLLARAADLAPNTEFVFLTGHGSLESAVEAFKTGHVFDYWLKPLEDINQLDHVVKRAVERHFLRAENVRLVEELRTQIHNLEIARGQLSILAERDGLTGLYNHKAIHHYLDEELRRINGGPLSIMMIDMDRFKMINDTYGHLLGDQVLRHLSNALVSSCSAKDLIGRCGGDEFMIVLPGIAAEAASLTAVAIKESLAKIPFQTPDGSRLPLALCFGIADTVSAGCSSASLVYAADSALYEGKHNGGGVVTLHMFPNSEDQNVESRKFDVLDGLVTAIDNKDHYTKKHSEDVTNYALKLVAELGLSGETLHAVRVAGLLHDIGKIGVPDFILRKPGKLTAGEYEVMKGHVTLSALIIHGLPRMNDILDAVSNHHERWDGCGYPKGLAGKDIPLLGRVMAIADAFSAMTLDRPYRAALSVDEALAEIEKGANSQFDPELVPVFVNVMCAQSPEGAEEAMWAA